MRHTLADAALRNDAPAARAMERTEQRWATLNWAVPWLLILATAAISLLLLFARWPRYWSLIVAEDTPMTWYQSVLLFGIALLALVNAAVFFLLADRRKLAVWSFLGFSFLMLTVDERFAIHERIRDSLLKPAGLRVPFLPWVGPGDFLLLLYLAVALALLPWLYQTLRERRPALILLGIGFLFGATAILLDSFDFERMSLAALRLEQTTEEVLEAFAFTHVLAGVVQLTLWYLRPLLLGQAESPRASTRAQ